MNPTFRFKAAYIKIEKPTYPVIDLEEYSIKEKMAVLKKDQMKEMQKNLLGKLLNFIFTVCCTIAAAANFYRCCSIVTFFKFSFQSTKRHVVIGIQLK